MPKLTFAGNRSTNMLYEYNAKTGIPTGQIKSNTPGDPDYIPPEENSPSCTPRELFTNNQISQRFTRNNCTGSQTGSSVTYLVPEGRYIAFTQIQADNLALLDISLNGQNYANANGTCSVS